MLKVHAKNLDTVVVLYVEGQIVNGQTEILRNAVTPLEGKSALILDLARITTIDAHGLGVLLALREQCLANGSRFKLMNVSKPIQQILEITRLDSVFQIVSGVVPPAAAGERSRLVAA